ncbi:hypothetical protein BDN71DRAFT_1523131 [Pleurotus eryngii]|uniref:CxC2-like cysteine cluster KDZ transposase-associated domain-containing protein n=1 Tax=Pleurotus eryngii TaxID=5323 RepID=A0A9P6D2X3_PLEER|nr:hypothetical protein BDN71DRAFT_1523131 [Pleurotus eryngii]
MSRPKRRRLASSFIYYEDSAEPDIAYDHVLYESEGNTLRRSTHSIHLPPASSQPAPPEVVWNDECTSTEQSAFISDFLDPLPDPGNFGDLDIAYIQELAELDLDMVKKRNRTAAKSGRGWAADLIVCTGCSTSSDHATFRCQDCFDETLYCESCIVSNHHQSPFHRIERWTEESYFVPQSLKALGLRIQLGHDLGKICLNPCRAKGDTFVIIDIQGVHEVGLDFCGCQTAQLLTVQLLQRGLFPSTVTTLQTAATFQVLDLFQMLSVEGRLSAFEFYKTLVRITDKTKIEPPRDRYTQFLRMSREWRHLQQLKRMARGHDPQGAQGTKPGELAVLCPVCPQPGMNLPAILKEDNWLHALFIGIDANFRLKRKNVSSDLLDPGLSCGWGYFVEDTTYQAHVTGDKTPVEKSSCVSHKAVSEADKRLARGLVVNGVGTVECTQHDFKRPLSVGDLRYGERYVNMDHIFFSSIKSVASQIPRVVASYDIACQWHIHLWCRMESLPPHLHYPASHTSVTTLVPKFHLPVHISTCQAEFLFNYTPGIGQTDSEAPERGWDYLNPAANQTKEMGPGSRRELLEDLMGDRNWKKTVSLGNTLLRQMKEAIPQCSLHVENHRELEAHIEAATVLEWRKVVQAWEADHSKPNPYMAETTSLSQDAICLRLADAKAAALAAGTLDRLHDEMTPSMYVASAITNYYDVQKLYCPAAFLLISKANGSGPSSSTNATEAVSRLNLGLPSSFKTLTSSLDALNAIRAGLHLRVSVFHHKDRFDRGQHTLTRSMGSLFRVQSQIDGTTHRYRVARAALLVLAQFLSKDDVWRGELQELRSEDICGLGVADVDNNSEGHRTISWIWRTIGVAGSDSENDRLHSSLHLEWCKSRARALRWTEEVQLLKEEMRRVLAFLRWQAEWWEGKVCDDESVPRVLAEGLTAYARRQASI